MAGTGYQYCDTQESVPAPSAQFQTEHKEVHFDCSFLPTFSPIGALLLEPVLSIRFQVGGCPCAASVRETCNRLLNTSPL